MNIAILGAGMVGRTMALDLAKDYAVTSFDVNPQNLELLQTRNADIRVVQADLQQYHQYEQWLQPFDLVVTAVPGNKCASQKRGCRRFEQRLAGIKKCQRGECMPFS